MTSSTAIKLTALSPFQVDALRLIGDARITLGKSTASIAMPAAEALALVAAGKVAWAERNRSQGVRAASPAHDSLTRKITKAAAAMPAPAPAKPAPAGEGRPARSTARDAEAITCRTCDTEKPATAFPTIGADKRGTKCRACRDAARKAA